MALGYAGWSAGQLEQELKDNSWLTVEASERVVFDTPLEERWSAAAGLVGVNPLQLPGYVGHACAAAEKFITIRHGPPGSPLSLPHRCRAVRVPIHCTGGVIWSSPRGTTLRPAASRRTRQHRLTSAPL